MDTQAYLALFWQGGHECLARQASSQHCPGSGPGHGVTGCLPASAAAHPLPGLSSLGPPASSHPGHLTHTLERARVQNPGVWTRAEVPSENKSERGFPDPGGGRGQRLSPAGPRVRPSRYPSCQSQHWEL